MVKNKYPIKRVMFQEKIDIATFTNHPIDIQILFHPNKWYDVLLENDAGLIFLYCENGEKIAIHPNDLTDKIIVQR